MEPFDSIYKNLDSLKGSLIPSIMDKVESEKDSILSINKDMIYKEGRNTTGKKMKRKNADYPVYCLMYETKKKKKGIYQGHIDFNFTGELLRSFKVKVNDTLIEVTAERIEGTFDLVEHLEEYYGEYLGLTDDDWEWFATKKLTPFIYDTIMKVW